MNEDYLDLDYNAVHTMMVACVNDSDPTIDVAPDPNYGQSLSKPTTAPAALTPAVPAPEPIGADPTNRQLQYRQTNTFVKPVCNELRRILGGQGLKELAQIEVQLVQNKVIGTPVDPMTATPASAAPKGASTKPP